MVASANADIYSPFQPPLLSEEGPQSSEEGSGLHSPVFGAQYSAHGDSFRYQHDQLDVHHPAAPAPALIVPGYDGYAHPHHHHSLNAAQQPPMLDSALELPNSNSSSARQVTFASQQFPIGPRNNHNQLGIDFRGPPPLSSSSSSTGIDFRYSPPTERRLPGGPSHDHSYARQPGSSSSSGGGMPSLEADHRNALVNNTPTTRSGPSPSNAANSTAQSGSGTSNPTASSSSTARKETTAPVVIACRQCRSRKIRCDSTRPVCNNCVRRSNECEYDLVPKRRGPDKRPGTRQRSCKKRPADGSAPPPPKRKRTSGPATGDRAEQEGLSPHQLQQQQQQEDLSPQHLQQQQIQQQRDYYAHLPPPSLHQQSSTSISASASASASRAKENDLGLKRSSPGSRQQLDHRYQDLHYPSPYHQGQGPPPSPTDLRIPPPSSASGSEVSHHYKLFAHLALIQFILSPPPASTLRPPPTTKPNDQQHELSAPYRRTSSYMQYDQGSYTKPSYPRQLDVNTFAFPDTHHSPSHISHLGSAGTAMRGRPTSTGMGTSSSTSMGTGGITTSSTERELEMEMEMRRWWERILRSYSTHDIAAEVNFLVNNTGHLLSFINVDYLVRRLQYEFGEHSHSHSHSHNTQSHHNNHTNNQHQHNHNQHNQHQQRIQPAFVYAVLAMAKLMKSSKLEGGAAGLAQATELAGCAHQAYEDALVGGWRDVSLAEAALILALFESSAHPQYSATRAASALLALDSVIKDLNLTTADLHFPDATRFHADTVPIIITDAPFDEMEVRCACLSLGALSPPGTLSPGTLTSGALNSGSLDPDTLNPSALSPDADPFINRPHQLPWSAAWTEQEVREEERRRVVWSALSLVSEYVAQCETFNEAPGRFWITEAANYALFFPGEILDRYAPAYQVRDGLCAKESVYALFCRAMLLWNFCNRFREPSRDEERAEQAQEAFLEAQAIEDALNAHRCNLDTTIMYTCREYLHNTRMLVAQAFRGFHGLNNGKTTPGPIFKRKQAEDWLFYEDQVISRVNTLIHHLAGPAGQQLTRRPFRITWFINQLAICIVLWNHDRTLEDALKLGKLILNPIDVLNELWPCAVIRHRCESLRQQLVEACHAVGMEGPLAPHFTIPPILRGPR